MNHNDDLRTQRIATQNELTWLRSDNARLKLEVAKWKRIRTPGHGPCCTCQACGENYDDCRCDLDDVADDLEISRTAYRGLSDSFRALRGAWFGRVLRQESHERESESEDAERIRTEQNLSNRKQFDASTEEILAGRPRIVAPTCMADLDRRPEPESEVSDGD